jgi:hypothetical protein
MEWILKLEYKDSQGVLISTTAAKIDRPELQSETYLGLTFDLGTHLRVEDSDGVASCSTQPCPSRRCGRRQR